MLQQVFENKVRELRIQQGLSQDELAFIAELIDLKYQR